MKQYVVIKEHLEVDRLKVVAQCDERDQAEELAKRMRNGKYWVFEMSV